MFNFFGRNPIVLLYTLLAIGIFIALIMWISGNHDIKIWLNQPATQSSKGDILIYIIFFGLWASDRQKSKS